MDADAKLDAALRREAHIPLDHAILHLDGAAHGVDNAAKLDQHAITRAFDDASVVQGNGRIDQVTSESPEPRKRPLLVGTGELAVSGYVRRKNGCEVPGLCHGRPSPHAIIA